ncbi:MAG: PspA/IM30 family protein [Candidatus Poribacteria bacterium]|nr:PspA/IM30 family protein [Candidatus Poribacteria bacterium]
MKRIKEISEQIRENISQFLEAVDGTESLLDKAIVDMKARLAEAKELVATAIAEEQRLTRAYQEAIATAKVWGEKADTALQNQDMARVKEARQRKQQQLDIADGYKRQIVAQEAVVASLKTALHEFYQQFQNAAVRAETLSHRQKQAETHAKLHKLIAAAANTISTAFEQAEQKLKTAEEKAEIWGNRDRSAATEVKKNVNDSDLDQALAELKNDVLGSNEK